MAAGILSSPGTKYGPCNEPCEHRDCNLTRQMAETKCAICNEPVGYEKRFYDLAVGHPMQLAHAVCYEEKYTQGGC